MFFIAIIFGIAFGMTYTLFENNIVIMLAIFNLLLVLSTASGILSNSYIGLWFISVSVMLYLEFGVDKKNL